MKNEKEFVKKYGFDELKLRKDHRYISDYVFNDGYLVKLGYFYSFKYKKWISKFNTFYTEDEKLILNKMIETNNIILKFVKHFIKDVTFNNEIYSAVIYLKVPSSKNITIATDSTGNVIGHIRKISDNTKISDPILKNIILT